MLQKPGWKLEATLYVSLVWPVINNSLNFFNRGYGTLYYTPYQEHDRLGMPEM